MATYRVDIKGPDGEQQATRLDNLGPVLEVIKNDILSFVDSRFAQSKSPSGVPWAPLKYRQGNPLIDTGNLRNSISAQIAAGTLIQVTTNVPYAGFHQSGTDTIPRRPFFPTKSEGDWGEELTVFEAMLIDWIEKGELG